MSVLEVLSVHDNCKSFLIELFPENAMGGQSTIHFMKQFIFKDKTKFDYFKSYYVKFYLYFQGRTYSKEITELNHIFVEESSEN